MKASSSYNGCFPFFYSSFTAHRHHGSFRANQLVGSGEALVCQGRHEKVQRQKDKNRTEQTEYEIKEIENRKGRRNSLDRAPSGTLPSNYLACLTLP